METRELIRLSTFLMWPMEAKVSRLTLAKRGFVYTGTGNAIRCEACNTMLDHVEQLDSTLERHKEQSPGCPNLLPASAPNIPCMPPELALAIAGLTVTDGGGPDGSMQDLMSTGLSAAAWANMHGVFPANTGSNLEPTGPVSSQAAHVDPSTQVSVNCEREQPNYEQPCSQSSPDSANHQVVSEVDQVSAMMDREELRILLPVIQNLGFNENDLKAVVAERLLHGKDCLVPTQLLEALLREAEN